MAARSQATPHGPGFLLQTAALGAATFALLHLVFGLGWQRWFQPAELEVAWFLGSRRSLVTAQVALGVVACLIGLLRPGSGWRGRWLGGASLAAGAIATMAVTFALLGAERLLVGPSRLWPAALIAAAILLALPVLAGTLASGLLRPPR